MEEEKTFASIMDIEIPENLTDKIQRSELIAYQKAMHQLEQDWIQLQKDENTDQIACINIITDQHERKCKKIDQKYNTKCQIIDQQHQEETERVNREFNLAQITLKDHLINAENSTDFTQMQSESQMDTRTKHHEEGKLRLSNQECENDLAPIQKIYERDEC